MGLTGEVAPLPSNETFCLGELASGKRAAEKLRRGEGEGAAGTLVACLNDPPPSYADVEGYGVAAGADLATSDEVVLSFRRSLQAMLAVPGQLHETALSLIDHQPKIWWTRSRASKKRSISAVVL